MNRTLAILLIAMLAAAPARSADAPHPARECARAVPQSLRVLCEEPRLTALHHRLTATLARVSAKAGKNQLQALAREQRDWLGSREACAGASGIGRCLETAYRNRIAALELTAGLVEAKGPFAFACGVGQTAWVTFGETHIPSARLQSSDYDLILFNEKERGMGAPGDETLFENNEFTLLTLGGQLLLSGNDEALWCAIAH